MKIKELIKDNHLDWANWLITRLMSKKQCIQYSIFAAESVINIYNRKYPEDDKPQKAIQAAKDHLKNPCKKIKNAVADTATRAAEAAALAAYANAYANNYATYTTAHTAHAAHAARAAAYAAYATVNDVDDTDANAYAVAYIAAHIAKKEMQIKILNYGIKILNSTEDKNDTTL